MRRMGILVMGVVASLAVSGGVASAQYPPEGPIVAVSEASVQPGGSIDVEGEGWMPESTVSLTLFSEPRPLDTAGVDSEGAFATTVVIPADVEVGPHVLQISGTDPEGDPMTVDVSLAVLAVASAEAEGGIGPGVVIGLIALFAALIVIGAVVVAGKRRSSTPATGSG
ncbi:MAG: hypothetical protein HY658_11265 [Actinobacteria bacterium]|nr:hypothetical protein [Actinomycetota bacterium]